MKRKYSGKKKYYFTAILLIVLASFLFWFLKAVWADRVITEYSGDYVALAELPSQLSFTYYEAQEWEEKLKEALHQKNLNGKLTYGKLKSVLKLLSVHDYIESEEGFWGKAVPRDKWNKIYDQILDLLDHEHEVSTINLVFLDEKGDQENQRRLTQKGFFQAAGGVDYFHHYDMFQVYIKEEQIIGVRDECGAELVLENVFVHRAEDKVAQVLYENQKLDLEIDGLTEQISNTVCDIKWKNKKVTAIYKKEDMISGKVLSFNDRQIEISGYGTLKHNGKLKVYKTYGTVEELDESKLVIGNLVADFVVAKKQVCGIILKEPASIENIRVLLLNGDGGNFHGDPILVADAEGKVTAGKKEKSVRPGQIIKAADYLGKKADYVKIELKEEGGRIYFSDDKGEHLSLGYRGSVEIRKYPEGYGVVNELSLEQYLYGVVPSEMPANYEREALRTQAVCARSYACIQLMRGDYAALGAHVDDSTNYQVYNKQPEDEKTSLAVDDTIGEVIKYNGEIAEAYFFSTSCGFTGDMTLWNEDPAAGHGYLQGISLLQEEGAPDISDNEKFTEFIKNQDTEAYDSESVYFRWTARLSFKDKLNEVNAAIAARYGANAGNVQITKADGAPGTDADLAGFGMVKNITAEERCAGGGVRKLNIAYEKGNVTLLTEYNLRCVLGAAATALTGKDGKPVDMALLPSAYIAVVPVEEGFVVYGGGYGHGIGMCQTGSNGMAKAGMNYVEILMKFYKDITIENVYNEEK